MHAGAVGVRPVSLCVKPISHCHLLLELPLEQAVARASVVGAMRQERRASRPPPHSATGLTQAGYMGRTS